MKCKSSVFEEHSNTASFIRAYWIHPVEGGQPIAFYHLYDCWNPVRDCILRNEEKTSSVREDSGVDGRFIRQFLRVYAADDELAAGRRTRRQYQWIGTDREYAGARADHDRMVCGRL